MTPLELAALARKLAAEFGFQACGITDLAPVPHAEALRRWLEEGMHGEMAYMVRQEAVRLEPARAWAQARSVVVVLHNYYQTGDHSGLGYQVARYAQGEDYHTVMGERLRLLGSTLVNRACTGSFRVFVDAGPLPERELAQRAGLGWIAKNTMLIAPRLGSYTFIGCVLTDLELAADAPFGADRCGSCTRCLDACPTRAFPSPRVLDATRCISYLTIEARTETPEALRPLVGDHLFGCDVCQEVCPWNTKFAEEAPEPRYRAGRPWPRLEEILRMDEAAFSDRFGPTALERAGRGGLQRNARLVLENS